MNATQQDQFADAIILGSQTTPACNKTTRKQVSAEKTAEGDCDPDFVPDYDPSTLFSTLGRSTIFTDYERTNLVNRKSLTANQGEITVS